MMFSALLRVTPSHLLQLKCSDSKVGGLSGETSIKNCIDFPQATTLYKLNIDSLSKAQYDLY